MNVAFHARNGMRENVTRHDFKIGSCYKNGGAPMWRFRAYEVQRGTDRRGAPIMKMLWEREEAIVAGRPVWEWARYTFLGLRPKQKASLGQIRNLLDGRGTTSPRKGYRGTSNWHELPQPSALFQ